VVYTTLLVRVMIGWCKRQLAVELAGWPWKDEALKARFAPFKDLEDWVAKDEKEIKSSGYVVDTLEAALWAFLGTETFQAGALRAVNLGDDADTVGAVYGGLAGAYYGIEGTPTEWMDALAAKEMVEEVVEGLVKLIEAKERVAGDVVDAPVSG
jgi:ADP-ribosylglycohydrolase